MKLYSEEEIITRLREGDDKALQFVFDQYYRALTLFAMKYVGDVEEAKELVQDLFVRLWLKRSELHVQFSLKTYLYQSVRNACLNYLEAGKTAQKRLRDYQAPAVSNDNPLEKMVAAEQEELLMRAIDKLPERCREIFVLSRFRRLSNQAIAHQLDISVKTVEAQMTIALRRLLEWLMLLLMFFAR